MADFEVLPVGTREAMQDAVELLRATGMVRSGRMADRLEALLTAPDFGNGDRVVLRSGQACWDSPDIVEDLSGNGRHLRWAEQVDLPKKGKPAVMGWDFGKEPAGPVQFVTVRGETFPVEEFDPEHRASVLELTPSMQLHTIRKVKEEG